MKKTLLSISKNFLPGISVLSIHFLVLFTFFKNSQLADSVYQKFIFKFFRKGFDQTLGHIDFPLIYAILPIVLVLLIIDIIRKRSKGFLQILAFLFNYACFFFVCFYIFWAYNYACSSLESRMKMGSVEVDKEYLIEKLTSLQTELSSIRESLDTTLRTTYHSETIEDLVRPELSKVLSFYGYYTTSKPRVKQLFDGGLMRLRTSGIYIPYVFEGHFDGSISQIQWPFTITHEMSHAYGVTDEKECNFLAYLVCKNSTNQHIKYSALIAHWRYLGVALIREDSKMYKELRSGLHPGVQLDLNQINEAITKYPELMPNARDKIYDQYLKSHGVKEGIVSYDKMIEMIAAWDQVNGTN